MAISRKVLVSAAAGAGYRFGKKRGAKAAAPPGRRGRRRTSGPAGRTAIRSGQADSPGMSPATPDDPQGSPIGNAPGKDATKPTDIPKEGWKQILKRAWRESKEDNVPMLASGIAYSAFLAIFPALIAAVTLYGLVADPAEVERQIRELTKSLPKDVANLISDQLVSIAKQDNSTLGLGLIISVAAALFSASGGVGNLIKAVNIAYDEQETRGFVRLRATALLLTLGGVVFIVVAIGLIAVLPAILNGLGLGGFAAFLVQVVRWLGLIAFVVAALAVVYRYAPDRDNPKLRWVGLGSLIATVLWVIGSAAFSFYASRFGSYQDTYGALAGVVILLLWLFLTSYIILLGAEINAETEAQTAVDTTEGEEKPIGEREAVKADTVSAGS